jgi:uncharacterized protein (TIGR02246 family)
MHPTTRWLFAAAVAPTALACSAAAPKSDPQADVAAINAIRDREIAYVAAGKTDSLLTLYTNDVVLMPPGEPVVTGVDALKKWTEAMLAQASVSGRYTSSQVSVAGDMAVDRYTGTIAATPKGGAPGSEEHMKGVHVLRRQADGTWKIAQDVWNMDAAAPAAPPPTSK